MPEPHSAPVEQTAPYNLISFLKCIPDSRYRREVRYPQLFLVLVEVLGILSCCRSSRDLEALARVLPDQTIRSTSAGSTHASLLRQKRTIHLIHGTCL